MICTEQERDALMAEIEEYGKAKETVGWSSTNDPYPGKVAKIEAKEHLAAIRAMLAPPDDAVIRERERLARVVAWANARLSLDGFAPRDTPAVLMAKHGAAWEALEPGDLDPVQVDSGFRTLQSGKLLRLSDGSVLDRNGFPDEDFVYGSLSDEEEAEISLLRGEATR